MPDMRKFYEIRNRPRVHDVICVCQLVTRECGFVVGGKTVIEYKEYKAEVRREDGQQGVRVSDEEQKRVRHAGTDDWERRRDGIDLRHRSKMNTVGDILSVGQRRLGCSYYSPCQNRCCRSRMPDNGRRPARE